MIAPAPTARNVPILLRDVSPEARLELEGQLRQQLGNVEIVESGEFARYVVDAKGTTVRVFGADGIEEVASFSALKATNLANKIAKLLARSATVSDLMALEHPSSQIRLEVRLVQGQDSRGSTDVKIGNHTFHIRQNDEERTLSNSVQMEIWTDTEGFLTIVDVDANGFVNLLFPNKYQKTDFHPEGFIRAGTTIRLPDSLQTPNRAGFHWDIVKPPGVDTVQAFLTTDYQTALLIRHYVRGRMGSSHPSGTRGGPEASQPGSEFGQLRGELIKQITRGIMTVPDQTNSDSIQSLGQTDNPHPTDLDWASTAVSLRITH